MVMFLSTMLTKPMFMQRKSRKPVGMQIIRGMENQHLQQGASIKLKSSAMKMSRKDLDDCKYKTFKEMEDWKFQMLLKVEDEEKALCIERFFNNELFIHIYELNYKFSTSYFIKEKRTSQM